MARTVTAAKLDAIAQADFDRKRAKLEAVIAREQHEVQGLIRGRIAELIASGVNPLEAMQQGIRDGRKTWGAYNKRAAQTKRVTGESFTRTKAGRARRLVRGKLV